MKRTKYVYTDNSAIAHLWIGHNLSGEGQSEARNPQRNFYFERETIYSYGSHFPIACFVRNAKGKLAIQFTTRGYSHTTSGHISTVRGAISGNDIEVFHVYFPSDTRKADCPRNIESYLHGINSAIADQAKSRSTGNISDARDRALSLETECRNYCAFWKVKTPKFPKIADLPEDFEKRRARELELQSARDERKRAEREESRKRWEIKNALEIAERTAAVNEWNLNFETHIAEWLAGGELNAPNRGYGYYDTSAIPEMREVPTLLRIKGDEIETSRYATIPLSHAKRGLALVRSVMARGEDWQANGHTCKLGLYSVSRITADGTVFAGCHVVPWESIARIQDQIDAYEATSPNSDAEVNW